MQAEQANHPNDCQFSASIGSRCHGNSACGSAALSPARSEMPYRKVCGVPSKRTSAHRNLAHLKPASASAWQSGVHLPCLQAVRTGSLKL